MVPPIETSEDELAETAKQVGKFEEFADDSDFDRNVPLERAEHGAHHTVKTKRGGLFSRNAKVDVAQEAYEQEQQDKQAEIEAAYTFGPEMEISNKTTTTSSSSPDKTGSQTMNPYRALVAKASDMSLRKLSSKGLRRH